MRTKIIVMALAVVASWCGVNAGQPDRVADKLRSWQVGVWLNPGGTYSVWTETHYFVVQGLLQQDSANIYCGASQVAFTDKGVARKQIVRVRKTPGQELYANTGDYFDSLGMEQPLVIDDSKFKPGTCAFDKGILYDSIDSVGTDFILLSTCGGDRIRLYSNGKSVYLPASGGEAWSVRIEGR